jgi:hypothetical protein
MSRFVTGPERGYLESPELIQLCLKLSDPSYTPRVLTGLIHGATGLRLRLDGSKLVPHDDPFPVIRLPDSIRDTRTASDFVIAKHSPDFSKTLATICSNDSIVVLNSHHCCGDGGYFRYLYDHVLDPKFLHEPAPLVPDALTDIFADQYRTVSADAPFTDPAELTRLKWRSSVKTSDRFARFIEWSTPITRLRCFNPASKRCIGLTESLFTALSISLMAFDATFSHKFGVLTCVDMRQMLPAGGLNLRQAAMVVCVNLHAPGVTQRTTLGEVGQKMRADFENKRKPAVSLPLSTGQRRS